MSIPACGTFDYRVVVQRSIHRADRWIGQARSLRGSSSHPGLAGERPMFELECGHIKLSSTESKLSRITNPHFRKWRRLPLASASFEVGDAPAMALQPEDELSFYRESTGDLALTVIRNESLILALGAVTHLPIGGEIQVEEDPRLKEWNPDLAYTFDQLEDPDNQVFWIDVGAGNLEGQLAVISRTPQSDRIIVGIRGTPVEGGRGSIPAGIWDKILRRSRGELSCCSVETHFRDKNAWIDYLRQMPRERPKDFYLSFTIQDDRINLCEGDEAYLGAYHVRVERIYRWGLPGEFSMLAIARLSDSLTREMVMKSAKDIMKV